MMWLHVEGHLICVTKMHEDYTWKVRWYVQPRSMQVTHGGWSGSVTTWYTSYTWNVGRNLNLKLIEILSTPCHGAVDQDWRSTLCVPKCTS